MSNSSKISFQSDGSPFSEQFNDIYFDTESGYQQSEHVFVRGNKIAERLSCANTEFTIGETGFGTGLNFLLTLQTYIRLQNTKTLPPLHFISTEKYPLTKVQLARSLESLPEIKRLSKMLIDVYPDSITENCTFTLLNGQIKVSLLIDDSTYALSKLHVNKNGLVDAWYLDGFSPAKNPDMWQAPLFAEIARLSKEQATISTFTVAGHVRRKLIDVGFRLKKAAYIGNKSEILTGVYQQDKNKLQGFYIRPNITKPQHVSIIGGGIASACAAYSLAKQGIKVTVYCKDDSIAQGASSNHIGALYPLIHQQKDDISVFYEHAFWQAKAYYQSITELGIHFDHQWCGLLELSFTEALRKRQVTFEEKSPWPKQLIHSVDTHQARELSNLPLNDGGLFMPAAGWIAPAQLVSALFKAAQAVGQCKVKTNINITNISQQADKWLLKTEKKTFEASILVLCGGAEMLSQELLEELPLYPVRGQISEVQQTKDSENLSTVICHKGYLTPSNDGKHCIGATFIKDSSNIEACVEEDKTNLQMLNKSMPNVLSWNEQNIVNSKARVRCMTPDHLPIVGPMPMIKEHIDMYPHLAKDKNWSYSEAAPYRKNLYTLTGLGARGLCSAPILAEILAADLCGLPYPIDNKQLFNLSANRFVIRDIIKRKYFNQ